jgi:hypothetical protein
MLEPQCPKCPTPREFGFVLDNGYGTVTQSGWAEGEPQRSIWEIGMNGRERHPVVTCRCSRCARLESYSPAEPRRAT